MRFSDFDCKLLETTYTLDSVGNGTQRVDQAGTHTYAYDNLYRLTSVTYPGPTTTSYAFDAFGNRTSMTDASGTTAYSYDDAERLTSVAPPSPQPAVSYSWDNDGDLTQCGSDTFTWDYEDRMTGATVGGVSTTFGYRGDGLRGSRTTGGTTTTFTWDVNRGLPVVLDDGRQYLYGAGLEAMIASGARYYYLADGLGSTMAIVDTSGAAQKSYTYDVYGKPTATGSLANEFDFAGQQTDLTGLQYLRARYMDPATGRFMSRDPLAASPGWQEQPFTYAGDNPATLSDPTGTCVWKIPCPDPRKIWWAARAELNKEISAAALAWATSRGGDCKSRKHGIIVCYGMDAGGIPDGKSTLTIGNVVMTVREYGEFDDKLFDHEERHADQWALAMLACRANPVGWIPGVGASCQAILGGTLYGLFPDFFENWANKEEGCYTQPQRPECEY